MPGKFDKLGISFQYPENWTVDEKDLVEGRRSVTVYSPGGAFWSVTLHSQRADPDELAQAVIEVMRQEYEDLEVEPARETVAGRDVAGYDLNFFYLDLTNTAQVRSLRNDRAVYVIFWQAEDRELAAIGRVFEAMTTSLLMDHSG
jgi:hypothetical protein